MAQEEQRVRVLVVGDGPAALGRLDGLDLERVEDLGAAVDRAGEGDLDVALVPVLAGEAASGVEAIREHAPDLAVIALTSDAAAGSEALDAGAADHLESDAPAEALERSIRYATTLQRLEREVRRRQTTDELTGLANTRGFEQLAGHHLRLADRSHVPVSIVFVRLEEADEAEDTPSRVAEAAAVLGEAVRGSDVLARVGTDVFAVLLTGDAAGAESLVLSRLVEALAAHDAKGDRLPLRISVGSAGYDPERPVPLGELMSEAHRHLREPDQE